jgi:hypothetical protein
MNFTHCLVPGFCVKSFCQFIQFVKYPPQSCNASGCIHACIGLWINSLYVQCIITTLCVSDTCVNLLYYAYVSIIIIMHGYTKIWMSNILRKRGKLTVFIFILYHLTYVGLYTIHLRDTHKRFCHSYPVLYL